MKNLKSFIAVITLIVVSAVLISIIYVHKQIWVKKDLAKYAKEMKHETEACFEFMKYNSIRQNNLLLIINNQDGVYSSDSLNFIIASANIKIDSILAVSDFFSARTNGKKLVEKNDSILLVISKVIDSYNAREIAKTRAIFNDLYAPLYFETDNLCKVIISIIIQDIVIGEIEMEKAKTSLMRTSIGLLTAIILSLLCIFLLASIYDRKRLAQNIEIAELSLKNRLSIEARKKDKRFQAAIDSAGFGILDWDLQNELPEVNDKWLEILDVTREEIEKYGFRFVLSKINSYEDLTIESLRNRAKKAVKNETKTIISYVNSKSKIIWIESFDFILNRDENNIPTHLFGFISDITEKKNFENKILESQYLLNESSKAGKIGHWEFDISQSKPKVSDEWLDVFSITRESYEQGEYIDWVNNMHIDFREIAIKNHKEIIGGIRKSFCTEYLYNHPTKGEIWIEGFGEVTSFDKEGQVQKYIGYHQDITRRKAIEEEAIKTATELKSWYQNMNLAFCVCQSVFDKNQNISDFRYLFVNEEFCKTVNISESDIINKCAGEFLLSTTGKSVISKLDELFVNKSARFEVYDNFLKKHFEIFAFSITENKFAMLYTDISERFRLQNKVAEEQKYYRQLFELSRDAIFIIDSRYLTFIDVNESCVKLFGAEKKSDFMALKYSMLYPAKQINGESSAVLLRLALKNIDKTGEVHNDWLFRRINGQEFIGQIRFTKIEYENNIAYLAIVRDTTQIYNAYENLERTRNWLQTIIDSLNTFVVVKDNYGKIIASNQAFNTTFGVSKEFVAGKKATEIYRPDEALAIQAIDDEIIYLGLSRTYEQKLTTAENKQQIFLITKTALKDTKGNVYAVVAQGTDITTIKSLEQKLRLAQQKAITANKAKSSFLANMSHEIRTPMNSIIGFAEILQKKLINPDHKEYVNSIFTAGNTLLTLINDILDLSKIEAGKVELRPVFCDLEILKSTIFEIFNVKTEDKKLEFSVEYLNTENFLFYLDENRLRQIIINIVGNAFKFTEKGFIKVIFSTVLQKNNSSNIIISIEDTGLGIPKEELNEIFNPFSQSENPDNDNTGGTGLGLSICDQLIGLMNGKIEVESELGKGSLFTITIPDVSYEISQTTNIGKNIAFTDYIFKPAKVLIVDDIKPNRDVLAFHLRDYNLDVYEASSGLQALEILEDLVPDLIIVDLRMPDINGVELTKTIRKSEKFASVKILAYTGAISFAMHNEKLNPIFDGLIIKPATKSSMTKELIRMLEYEEITMEVTKGNDLFNFNDASIKLIKNSLESISANSNNKLTNRQITKLLQLLKESNLFEGDAELQNYVHTLSKAVEDFNVILIEHLSGVLFLTNDK